MAQSYPGQSTTGQACDTIERASDAAANTAKFLQLAFLRSAFSIGSELWMSFDFTEASAFRNHFDRVSVYASYPLGNFLGMAGYQHGRDETPVNPAAFSTNSALQKFSSTGAFAEGTYSVGQYLATGVRYDRFHPNTVRLNTQWAITPYVNIPLNNGFQIIAEYQHRDFRLDATNHRQNDTFQVRIIFIQ